MPVGEPLSAAHMLQLTLALVVVLLAFAAVAFVLKRYSGLRSAAAGGRMRILDGLNVGTRERLVLVQLGTAQVLLGVSPGRIQTLHVIEDPSAQSLASDFASQLDAASQHRGQSTGDRH